MVKIGEQIAIRVRFKPGDVRAAMYTRVLHIVIPIKAVRARYQKCLRISGISSIKSRMTKERETTTAIADRSTTRVTGDTELASIRATMKFPDQIAVAAKTRE